MSYRLITKASFNLAGSTREIDVRAYAAPKGQSQGSLVLNSDYTDYKLTGGQGRGTVVRCYMYFMLKGESAYVEITRDELAEIKTGNLVTIDTITTVKQAINDSVVIEPAAAEPVAPKAKRTRKGAAVAA